MNIKEIVNFYKTDFDLLIYKYSGKPGANEFFYSDEYKTKILKQYKEKYNPKTVKKLVKLNELTWVAKGYKISWKLNDVFNEEELREILK